MMNDNYLLVPRWQWNICTNKAIDVIIFIQLRAKSVNNIGRCLLTIESQLIKDVIKAFNSLKLLVGKAALKWGTSLKCKQWELLNK